MSARTEPPTPRRLRDARRRGEVAVSRELTGAAALATGLGALIATGPHAARALAAALQRALAEAVGPAPPPAPAAALARATAALAAAVLPTCGAAALGALAAGLAQSGGLFTLEAVRLRLERLDLARGLARLVSGARLAGLALAAGKAAAALALAGEVVRGALPEVLLAPRLEPALLLRLLPALALRIALPILGLLAVLGLVDLGLARRRLRRALRMTKAEVARERREDGGDPRLVAERRRLARTLGAGPVRQATCLVVNPTHVAVALRHEPFGDEAPWVVAKGVGAAAARLRAEARRAGVPVVRDVALARALFRLAEVGDAIPEELYDAAAAVLVHVRGLGAGEGT